MKITALMSVWNSSQWILYNLRNIYPYFDYILVSESCWVPGEWEGNTSPDGTAAIVKRFQEEEDVDHKVIFHSAGRVKNQPEGRNSALHLIPKDTSWIYMIDSDEFYFEEDLDAIVRLINRPLFSNYSTITVPALCFYFDFTYFKEEEFCRGFRWFPGQHFYAIASMIDSGGKNFNLNKLDIKMMHYSYVSKEWTKLKACIGEDVTEERYKSWWNTVYSQFDGDLEKLYSRNGGGVHVFGGGPLKRYYGKHPLCLGNHPLRNWRWATATESLTKEKENI
jgi:glycosyltransferase involved in cell wall biosynthesis